MRKTDDNIVNVVAYMAALHTIILVPTIFGSVLRVAGLIDAPWLTITKPAILLAAADISLVAGAAIVAGVMYVILRIWEKFIS